jgi:RNA polymerase I-specific transcription initiation factor RRN7
LFSSEVPLSILDQNPATLDAYLDFCEKALLVDDKTETRPGSDLVRSFFPLAESKALDSDQSARRSSEDEGEGLPLNEHDETSEELEPGQEYKVYDALDVYGEIEGELEIVVRRAAEWVKVDVEDIFGVLEMFERRVVKSS